MASSEPVLAVKWLDAYYGQSHVLQGVEFEMGSEPIAIIGRNGMGNGIFGRSHGRGKRR